MSAIRSGVVTVHAETGDMQKRIGEFLIEKGVITEQQLRDILKYSGKTGLRLGDAGMAMGIITRAKLVELFGPNFAVDFFHLNPTFFPVITKELLTAESILKFGALPLGFKTEYRMFKPRKILNLGLLNPSRADSLAEVEKAAQAKLGREGLQGVKVFLVLADQFLDVVRDVYGMTDEKLRKMKPTELDATLTLFLETAEPGKVN